METIVQDSIELWNDPEWNKGKIESKNEVGMNFWNHDLKALVGKEFKNQFPTTGM